MDAAVGGPPQVPAGAAGDAAEAAVAFFILYVVPQSAEETVIAPAQWSFVGCAKTRLDNKSVNTNNATIGIPSFCW